MPQIAIRNNGSRVPATSSVILDGVEVKRTPWGLAHTCLNLEQSFWQVFCNHGRGGFMLGNVVSALSTAGRGRLRLYQHYAVAGFDDPISRAIFAWEMPQHEIPLLAGTFIEGAVRDHFFRILSEDAPDYLLAMGASLNPGDLERWQARVTLRELILRRDRDIIVNVRLTDDEVLVTTADGSSRLVTRESYAAQKGPVRRLSLCRVLDTSNTCSADHRASTQRSDGKRVA